MGTEVPRTEVASDDCALYSVVGADMAIRQIDPNLAAGPTIVADQTPGPSAYLSLAQIQADTAEASDVSGDLFDSLRERNAAAFPLPGSCTMSAITVAPARAVSSAVTDREAAKRLKAVRALQFWRPGFSADGLHAVVRLWFGPSPHGAIATYYLKRTPSAWAIVWSRLSFYA